MIATSPSPPSPCVCASSCLILFSLLLFSCLRLEPSVFDSSQSNAVLAAQIMLTSRVAAPTFSPSAGHYSTTQTISINPITPGASIYYTTDGSTPTSSSTLYTTPFHIWKIAGKTIKAVEIRPGVPDSAILSGVFSYSTLKTGQALCYDQVGNPIACAGTRQDGELQYGVARSFTGPTAHVTYTSDYTTTDNATGLVWKSCAQGFSGATCALGGAQTLTWANAESDPTWGCSALNSANSGNGYAGITTWRLPTRMEFETLIDHDSTAAPRTFNTAFPAVLSSDYWTSTTYAPTTTSAWYIGFFNGWVSFNPKTNAYNVRCVSGPVTNPIYSYTDNGDGTVKDNATGLIWQKCTQGQNNDSTCSGAATTSIWSTAVTYCNGLGLAGRTWRTPNIQELKTLADTRATGTSRIDATAFPSTPPNSTYISSTSWDPDGATLMCDIYFGTGVVESFGKSNTLHVRCVSGP